MESYSKFNHIKIHTQYSICEGALKIDELSEFCKKKRVKVLGLSDSFNLCGALEFSENISKSGTQPILGTQVNFKYKDIIGKVPLIAKSEIGYKSIIQLSSKSFIENDNLDVPHCDIGELLSLSGDIIVLSGSLNSLTGKLFEKDKISEIEDIYILLKKKFKNDFYIEIQRHNDFNEKNFENLNLKLSEELKIPIIATNEVYYLEKEMHEAHDALMCIGNKTNINDQNRKKLSDQHYLKNDNELEKLFYDLPEALENNYNLVYKINFRPKASKPVLPNIGNIPKFFSISKILFLISSIGIIFFLFLQPHNKPETSSFMLMVKIPLEPTQKYHLNYYECIYTPLFLLQNLNFPK